VPGLRAPPRVLRAAGGELVEPSGDCREQDWGMSCRHEYSTACMLRLDSLWMVLSRRGDGYGHLHVGHHGAILA